MPLEVRQARQQSIDVAEAWLALYRELHNKLLKLAAKRRPADPVLRARPVEGDVDHETLTREIMTRFPKILAALAK
jgi:acyl carrier protein phosphodiesterase